MSIHRLQPVLGLMLLLTACGQPPGTPTADRAPADSPYAGGRSYPWSSRLDTPDGDPYARGRTYPWASPTASAGLGALALGTGDNALSDLTWTSATNSWGPIEKDRSNGEQGATDGRALTVAGQVYRRGLGMHAAADVRYALGGQCSRFSTLVGVDDEVGRRGSVVFQVWDGQRRLYDSGTVRGGDAARAAQVDVTGVRDLRLVVTDAGDSLDYDHADWLEPTLTCAVPPPTSSAFLSDLAYTSATSGWGPVEFDRSNGEQAAGDGSALRIGGQVFAKGLGVHSASTVTYALGGRCTRLTASVGVDDEVGDRGSLRFEVYGDSTRLYDSGTTTGRDAARPLDVDVSARQTLRLVVSAAGSGDYGHGDWADARVECAASAPPPPAPAPGTTSWAPLFNGRDLNGWYTWLPSQGRDRDPQGVFRIDSGLLHVLDLPVTTQNQEFGYLATTAPYADYRLRLRYRWGTKKFAPRLNDPRDAGLVYGATGPDTLWPTSAELQIQEHDTGDLWLIGGTNATVRVASPGASPLQFAPLGTPLTTTFGAGAYGRVRRSAEADRLTDWNDVEVIVSGDESTHIVNGQVVNQTSGLRAPSGTPVTSGRILLQAEGAEVWYGGIELRPLAYTPPPAGATVLFGGSPDLARWTMVRGGGPVSWPVTGGALTVQPSADPTLPNDIRTVATFGDFRLHLEFRVPATSPTLDEQARGNSGVYLQGRYELQILDSYGRTLGGQNDAGAIYGVRDASGNASLPAGVWQSYDVVFRAARWSGSTRTASASISAWLNGDLVQDAVTLNGPTLLGDPETATPGPVRLQDHGTRVQFRNIWIQPM